MRGFISRFLFRDLDARVQEAATLLARDGGAREASETAMREAVGVNIDADDDNWRRLSGDPLRDLTPMTQLRMQQVAAYLWEQNNLANRVIELPLAFILAEGVKLTVHDAEHQDWLHDFWVDPVNNMDLRLPEMVRELSLFGEQVYPVFCNEFSGHVRLGYLDPELIDDVLTDPDNRSMPMGVRTVPDSTGVQRTYRTVTDADEMEVYTASTRARRASYTAGECFYFRVNSLAGGRRGRSDLLSQADWIDSYDQFLFGESERANLLRAFFWDIKLSNTTESQVAEYAKKVTVPRPGTAHVHNDSVEWTPQVPRIGAQDLTHFASLMRNHVLGGATIPEHWYGGAGDANRAVGAEMTEPTVKVYSLRQRHVKHMLEMIGRYVLRKRAERLGQTPDFTDRAWKVQAIFPEMAPRDLAKYAAALPQVTNAAAQAIDLGLFSEATALRVINSVAERLGVSIDVAQELGAAKDAKEELLKAREAQDVFHTPLSGGSGVLTPDVSIDVVAQKLTAALRAQGNAGRFPQVLGRWW